MMTYSERAEKERGRKDDERGIPNLKSLQTPDGESMPVLCFLEILDNVFNCQRACHGAAFYIPVPMEEVCFIAH